MHPISCPISICEEILWGRQKVHTTLPGANPLVWLRGNFNHGAAHAGEPDERRVTQSVSERAHSWIIIPWDSMNSRMRLRGQPNVE